MTDILERAEKHFAARRELREIEVPEWEGSVFFYDPPNVRERSAILECFDREKGRFSPDVVAVAFMARVRNEKGQSLFSQVAWAEQKRRVLDFYDPDVLERIVAEMGGLLDGPDLEEAEKN